MHIRKALRLLALGVSIGIGYSAITPANAFFCAYCVTFYQQASQYAKEVETALNTARQLQQHENVIKQGANPPNSLFGSITGDLRKVTDLYSEAQSLDRGVQNMEAQFNAQFPGYQSYLKSAGTVGSATAADRYQKWLDDGRDNVRAAMKVAGVNTGSFESEDEQLVRMVSRSQTAAGRMQSIRVGSDVAAQNVQQLQKLRDLLAILITMQDHYMALHGHVMADEPFNKQFVSGKAERMSARPCLRVPCS